MTHYVQVCRKPADFRIDGWKVWINCKEGGFRETALLAAEKYLREQGYRSPDAIREPLPEIEFTVYVSDGKIRHTNGAIAECHGFLMKIRRQGKVA